MDISFNITRVRNAFADINNDKRDIKLRKMRETLLSEDEVEDKSIIPLLDILIEFVFPLQRVFGVIDERLKEEKFTLSKDWSYSSGDAPYLFGEDMFYHLTHSISFPTVVSMIKKLNCPPSVEDDLIEQIHNNNYEMFKKIIADNNVDYTSLKQVCSYLASLTIERNVLIDKQEKMFAIEDGHVMLDEDFVINICAAYDEELKTVEKILRNECEEEKGIDEILQMHKNMYEIIKSAFERGDNKEAISVETIFMFRLICCALYCYNKDNELTEYEREFVNNFINRQSNEFPIIKEFFGLFTKGELFKDNFELIESDIENEDFYALLDSCVKSEQPQLPLLSEMHEGKEINEHIEADKNVSDSKEETIDSSNNDSSTSSLHIDEELKHSAVEDVNPVTVFTKAIEKKYMCWDCEGKKYIWNKKQGLLDYLCGAIYCGDKVCKDEYGTLKWKKNRTTRLPRKKLNKMFGQDYIGKYRSKQTCNGEGGPQGPPEGYTTIDDWINDCK